MYCTPPHVKDINGFVAVRYRRYLQIRPLVDGKAIVIWHDDDYIIENEMVFDNVFRALDYWDEWNLEGE